MSDLQAAVFQPDAAMLQSHGFGTISHVPVLFGATGSYLDPQNRYLRDRALLRWPAGKRSHLTVVSRTLKYPRTQSLEKYAKELLNFEKYCNKRRPPLNWRFVQYDPDIIDYRNAMRDGQWSDKNNPHGLADETINGRINTVCDFLEWGAAHGHREQFNSPAITIQRTFRTAESTRRVTTTIVSRPKSVRQKPIDLRIPSKEDLSRWLLRLRRTHGYTKALACRTMLEVALRREECAQLPIDFLPVDRSQWNVIDSIVMVYVKNGTKGGKIRLVEFPIGLAYELDAYRHGKRLTALAKWRKQNPGKPNPPQLFLSHYNGRPLKAKQIYRAWKSKPIIYNEWSPHLARHTWACYELLDGMMAAAQSYGLSIDNMPPAWVEVNAKTIIALKIQPQLGHLSSRTTSAYLRWVHRHFTMPRTYETWHDYLEQDGS